MPRLTIREVATNEGDVAYIVINYGKELARFETPGEAEEWVTDFHQSFWGEDE